MAIDLQHCRENFSQRAATQQAARETLRQQAHQAAIAAILQIAPNYPPITQIYLFGSVTRSGGFHSQSDIDIAVAGTDATAYFALWRDLEAACPDWAIDLREINQPSHFTNTVHQFGELVYESSGGSAQSEH
jgi:predicted nucleotidyltransferase